jgi:hypothetical protein
MAAIKRNSITRKYLTHKSAERLRPGSDQMMNMIIEQTPGKAESPGLRKTRF